MKLGEITVLYTVQVYLVKKSQWKTGILLKMDIYSEDDTFGNSKPGNFKFKR